MKQLNEAIKARTAYLCGKSATVVGIGRSNLPLAEFLMQCGMRVTARDRKARESLGEAADTLERMGVELICGEGYLDGITEDYIFRAPGVRYDKPEFTAAVGRGSILTSEMQLFFELCPCPIVGITGSDGKTTTTTLISLMLSAVNEGRGRLWLGGNIGRPLLGDLCEMTERDYAVVELSSFQLHTMTRSPNVAVVTNVAPNHLDYHLGMEEYIAAKSNIFAHQHEGDTLILNAENEITASMAARARDGVSVRLFNSPSDYHFDDKYIYSGEEPLIARDSILLPGRHNLENYSAAIAASEAAAALCGLSLKREQLKAIAESFGGVEHRLEFVRELDGVRYYNGSIDSSPTRTLAALTAFTRDEAAPTKLIVICGGYDKHIPYEPLAPGLCRYAKCVVLTGATAPKIKAALDEYTTSRELVPPEACPCVIECESFEGAIAAAHDYASSGDIVLLSPASASFDRFKDFEERGRCFKSLVNSLTSADMQ